MKHLLFACLIIIVAVFYTCEKEPGPGPGQHPDPAVCDCSIPSSDTNLIVGFYQTTGKAVFYLEDQDSVVLPDSCFLSIEVDSSRWEMKVITADSSELLLPYFGTFEIPGENIWLDPYDRAPLAALAEFSTPYPARVLLRVEGITEDSPDLVHLFEDPALVHLIPVYGLYADYDNRVTVSLVDRSGRIRSSRTLQIITGPLERIICGPMTVTENQIPDSLQPVFFLIQNAIYDTEGYVRWFSGYGGQKFFPMYGNLIAIQLYNDKGNPAPTVEDIRIMNLLGKLVATYDVPNRNHHEISEKTPGGNLLVATNSEPYFNTDDDTEDAIVEIDRTTGDVVRFWDLREIFDPSRQRLWTEMPNDWCHLNSIQYDSTDNTLLISSKLQYFIAKIDYNTSQIRWIFGNHENWKEPWQKYLLTPVNFNPANPASDWTYGQHMPRITADGTVTVYDNGRKRPGGAYTRALEFRVDTTNMTVETVWDHDFSFYTKTMGSVQIRPGNNVLVGHGERGILTELTRHGDVLFSARVLTFYRAYPFEFYP